MDKYNKVWGGIKNMKQLMVVKNFSKTKILSRLNLTMMMIYH